MRLPPMNAAHTLDEQGGLRAGLTIRIATPQLNVHVTSTDKPDGAVDVTCTNREGQLFGWVRVRPSDRDAVLIENLNVLPPCRGAGLGVLLLASALAVGARWGRSMAQLEADDRGTGRLFRWYEDLGFEPAGTGKTGHPAFEAPIGRALSKMQEKLSTR